MKLTTKNEEDFIFPKSTTLNEKRRNWFLCYHLGVIVKRHYHLRVIFKILALALFNSDWTPLLGPNGSTPRPGAATNSWKTSAVGIRQLCLKQSELSAVVHLVADVCSIFSRTNLEAQNQLSKHKVGVLIPMVKQAVNARIMGLDYGKGHQETIFA